MRYRGGGIPMKDRRKMGIQPKLASYTPVDFHWDGGCEFPLGWDLTPVRRGYYSTFPTVLLQ